MKVKRKLNKRKSLNKTRIVPWKAWAENNQLVARWQGISTDSDKFGKRLLVFEVVKGTIKNHTLIQGHTLLLHSSAVFIEQIKAASIGDVLLITYNGMRCGRDRMYHSVKVDVYNYAHLRNERQR